MPTLLHVDSSPLGEASISRKLSNEFVAIWKQVHPDGLIIRRDLATSNLQMITEEWINASFTPEPIRTPDQREVLSHSDTLIGEVEAADEYIIGVPMHNFTVAAALRLWIDQLVRAGKTFTYINGIPTGLLKNKKCTFVVASGGDYKPGTAMASLDFVEPYLRTIFGFLGITDVHFFMAGGVAAIRAGKVDRDLFLRRNTEAIRASYAAA